MRTEDVMESRIPAIGLLYETATCSPEDALLSDGTGRVLTVEPAANPFEAGLREGLAEWGQHEDYPTLFVVPRAGKNLTVDFFSDTSPDLQGVYHVRPLAWRENGRPSDAVLEEKLTRPVGGLSALAEFLEDQFSTAPAQRMPEVEVDF